MFTSIARSLFSTLESMATPCSVKVKGSFLLPPQLDITICDFKFENSDRETTNIKSHYLDLLIDWPAWLKVQQVGGLLRHGQQKESKMPNINCKHFSCQEHRMQHPGDSGSVLQTVAYFLRVTCQYFCELLTKAMNCPSGDQERTLMVPCPPYRYAITFGPPPVSGIRRSMTRL